MLIKCNRHTREDLELWKSYEEADFIYYRTHNMQVKEKKAIEILENFYPNYISISWGKDSTVLAHLNIRSVNIPMIWIVVKDIVNPYCFEVRDRFLVQYPESKYEEINVERWFDLKENRLRATGIIEKGFKIANKKYGNRYASGVRAEESGIREIVMKLYGYETINTCRPLGWWKLNDIFAYLSYYKLPIHSNYAMLGGGRYKREYLRVASLGIKRGDRFDKELWEKEYYSDILRQL